MLRKISVFALVAVQALVPAYAQSAQYYYRYNKTVVTGTETTTPPTQPTGSKHDIPDVTLAAVVGNVNGPAVSSLSPKTALAAIASSIDGGVSDIVYDGAAPLVPGLAFNSTAGVVSGVPAGVYSGNVVVSYHDTSANVGKVNVPVTIYPQPALVSSEDVYTLPRLAQAASYGIGVTPANGGFYAGVTYAVAPGSAAQLPPGLTLSNGQVVGSTQAAPDTSYKVTIRGTSTANAAVYADKTIEIDVVGDQAMTLALTPKTLNWQVDTTGAVTAQDKFSPAPGPKGTFVNPVTWSLVGAPAWLDIGSDGQLTGTPPSLGSYVATVQVRDAQQTTATDTATVAVVAAGSLVIAPGGLDLSVRTNEAWATPVQTASQTQTAQPYSGTYTFTGESVPANVTLDPSTGVFTGTQTAAGTVVFRIHAHDELGRRDTDPRYGSGNYPQIISAYAPVTLARATSATGGAQGFSPLSVSWPKAANIIGTPTYTLVGAVPGSLYYKDYDNNDASQPATYTPVGGTGGTVRQQAGETAAQTEARLPSDHLVFDRLALTLTGIPSQTGTFSLGLHVSDDHMDTGYTVDHSYANRVADNSATSPASNITVAAAPGLALSTDGGQTQTVYAGMPLSITVTVSNVPFGGTLDPSGWSVSGTLPDGMSASATGNVLTIAGTPTTAADYDNIVVTATDATGRHASTALSISVVKSTFVAKNSDTAETLLQYADDAAITTTLVDSSTGAAYANGATWTLASGTLPPGVVATVSDDTSALSYDGSPTDVGTWKNITWTVTDAGGTSITTSPVSFTSTQNPKMTITAYGGPFDAIKTGVAMSWNLTVHNVTANGTLDNSAWTVTGTLPPGVSYDPHGNGLTFSGVPTAAGTFGGINVAAVDSVGKTANLAVSFKVSAYAPYHAVNSPSTFAFAALTSPVSFSQHLLDAYFSAYRSGVNPWTLNTGTLPPGIKDQFSADGINHSLSGYATQEGTYANITWKITDSFGHVAYSPPVTFVVGPRADLAVAASGPASLVVGKSATVNVTASNVPQNSLDSSAWSVTGNLPDGLTAVANGKTLTISGKPTASGHYEGIYVSATDSGGETAGTPLVFDVSDAYLATNVNGSDQSPAAYTDTANLSTVLQVAATGATYTTAGATWSLASGTIPPGITTTVSSNTSTLTYGGYPTVEGSYANIVWQVTDAKGNSVNTQPVSFTVRPRAALTLAASPSTSNTVAVGTASTVSITPSNVAKGLLLQSSNFTVSGTLPPGISYSVTNGVLNFTGTATKLGTYNGIVVTASDSGGGSATSTLAYVIGPSVIDLDFGGANQVLAQYTSQPTLNTAIFDGPSNTPYTKGVTWTLSAGTLPPGIKTTVSADGSTLAYSGYPTQTGTWSGIVWTAATLDAGTIQTKPVSFTVGPRAALSLASSGGATIPVPIAGDATLTVTASNLPNGTAIADASWTVSGSLPDGVTYAPSNGTLVFSGSPSGTSAGNYTITVSATDAVGGKASVSFTYKVYVAISFLYLGGGTSQTVAQSTGQVTGYMLARTTGNFAYTGGGTYALVAGTLPPGIGWTPVSDGSGVYFSGYPTTAGTYPNVTFALTDPYGNVVTANPYTFTVTPRAALTLTSNVGTSQAITTGVDAGVTITPSNLAGGTPIAASAWTISGNLPSGMTATSSNSGLTFSGSTNVAGTYPVTVGATDAAGGTASITVNFVVSPSMHIVLVNGSTSVSVAQYTGSVGVSLATRTVGNGTYTGGGSYSLASGSLPPGISLASSPDGSGGSFTGYATAPGTYSNVVLAFTDSYGNTVLSGPFTFTVTARDALALTSNVGTTRSIARNADDAAVTITPSNLANGVALTASGWTVGALPAGLVATAGANLVISGKTSAAVGSYSVAIGATDSRGGTANLTLTFTVTQATADFYVSVIDSRGQNAAIDPQTIVQTTTAANWTVQARYNATINWDPDVTWSIASGALPVGLTPTYFNDGHLSITGYATVAGTFTVVFRATNTATGASADSASFVINVTPRAALSLTSSVGNTPSVITGASDAFTVTAANVAYSGTLDASAWTVTGTLPAGVTYVTGTNVVFSGSSTALGTYPITVSARDSGGGTASVTVNLTITTGLTFFYSNGMAQTVAQYTGQPTAFVTMRDSTGATYRGGGTFAVASGTLPPGITLSSASDGSIASFVGYPTATGSYPGVAVQFTDPSGNTLVSSTWSFNVTARTALAVTSNVGTARTVSQNVTDAGVVITPTNLPYGTALTASSWTVGTLPAGMTKTAGATLAISGITTAAVGTYPVTITAKDSLGGTASVTVTFAVTKPTPAFYVNIFTSGGQNIFTNAPASSTVVQQTTNTSWTVQARYSSNNNWDPDVDLSIVAGGLPTGMSATYFDDGHATITGYAQKAGTYNVTFRGIDANTGAYSDTASLTITVTARPAMTVTPSAASTTLKSGVNAATMKATLSGGLPNGDVASPSTITWAVTGAPLGITWSTTSTGVLQFAGISDYPGTYTVTAKATDSVGTSASNTFTIIVSAPTDAATQAASQGTAWSYLNRFLTANNAAANSSCPTSSSSCYYVNRTEQLAVNTTVPGTAWQAQTNAARGYGIVSATVLTGSLPPGITVGLLTDKSYIQFSGTATVAGIYTATIVGTDSAGVKVGTTTITFSVTP